MHTLLQLAHAGNNVICSIHQQNSAIFSLFDDLTLVASGKQLYSGAGKKAEKHFTKTGSPPSEKQAFNSAERYLQLLSTNYSSDDTVRKSRELIDKLAVACAKTTASITGDDGNPIASESTTTSADTASGIPNGDLTTGSTTPVQGRVLMSDKTRTMISLVCRPHPRETVSRRIVEPS